MSTAFNDGTDLAWFDTVPGEQMALWVHSDAVGGAFTLIEAHVPAYTGPPMHYYEDGEEIPGCTPAAAASTYCGPVRTLEQSSPEPSGRPVAQHNS
jgi:hypothetical protein